MPYGIELRPAARRDLAKLDPFIRRKVVADIENLADNPRPHGVEKLEASQPWFRSASNRPAAMAALSGKSSGQKR